jgi:hypothetical protein
MQSEESKILIEKLLDEFDPTKQPSNQAYLESQIDMLNKLAIQYRTRSKDSGSSARNRSISRDMEQNCLGLINGIMFALSFIEHKNIDLANM